MNKFNIESAKFLSIIIVICFVFIMVVWKAFDYLPSSDAEKIQAQAETFVEEEQVNEEQMNEEQPSEENLQEEEVRMRSEREAMLR